MDNISISLSFDETIILLTALDNRKAAISECTDDYIQENMPPVDRLIQKIKNAPFKHI